MEKKIYSIAFIAFIVFATAFYFMPPSTPKSNNTSEPIYTTMSPEFMYNTVEGSTNHTHPDFQSDTSSDSITDEILD